MKKIIKTFVATFLVFSCLVSGLACSKHEHQYIESDIAATCSSEGYNLFTCECGDSYKGEKVFPKTSHTGMKKCSSCGLDYFEELKNLIINNGSATSSNCYTYLGKTTSQDGSTMTTAVFYYSDDNEIQIYANFDVKISDYSFILTIPHPSNGDALLDGKYAWIGGVLDYTAIGLLTASTFTEDTSMLLETVYDGFTPSMMSSARSIFAFVARYAIDDAFIPLLNLSNNGLTIKNFGFINYNN